MTMMLMQKGILMPVILMDVDKSEDDFTTTVNMMPLMVTLMQIVLVLAIPEPIKTVHIMPMMILMQLTLMMVMLVPMIMVTLMIHMLTMNLL